MLAAWRQSTTIDFEKDDMRSPQKMKCQRDEVRIYLVPSAAVWWSQGGRLWPGDRTGRWTSCRSAWTSAPTRPPAGALLLCSASEGQRCITRKRIRATGEACWATGHITWFFYREFWEAEIIVRKVWLWNQCQSPSWVQEGFHLLPLLKGAAYTWVIRKCTSQRVFCNNCNTDHILCIADRFSDTFLSVIVAVHLTNQPTNVSVRVLPCPGGLKARSQHEVCRSRTTSVCTRRVAPTASPSRVRLKHQLQWQPVTGADRDPSSWGPVGRQPGEETSQWRQMNRLTWWRPCTQREVLREVPPVRECFNRNSCCNPYDWQHFPIWSFPTSLLDIMCVMNIKMFSDPNTSAHRVFLGHLIYLGRNFWHFKEQF